MQICRKIWLCSGKTLRVLLKTFLVSLCAFFPPYLMKRGAKEVSSFYFILNQMADYGYTTISPSLSISHPMVQTVSNTINIFWWGQSTQPFPAQKVARSWWNSAQFVVRKWDAGWGWAVLKGATGLQEGESTGWGVGEKYSEDSYYILWYSFRCRHSNKFYSACRTF